MVFGPFLYFYFESTSIGQGIVQSAVGELGGAVISLKFIDDFVIAASDVKLFLVTPFMIFGGTPGWYVLGWVFRWLEKNKDKDIEQVADDLKKKKDYFLS